ncbi:MAG TPA: endo-1,4-beta-xylanase [Polyangiaceae bacterium]|nr:endo-1,4-beta-xylanase [Polyangiaceae bacterium]
MQFSIRAGAVVRKHGFELLLVLVAGLCIGGCAASDNGDEGGSFTEDGSMHSSGAPSAAGKSGTSGSPAAGTPGAAGAGAGAGGAQARGGSGGSFGGTAGGGYGGTSQGGSSVGGRGGMSGTAGASGHSSAGAASGGAPALGKFVGNITTGSSIDTGGMKFSKYWDQITPENAGKWGSIQRSASGDFNWSAMDAIYEYTETNHIIFKQHTFVWGSQQPSGTPTLAQVENWIKSFCQRYPNTRLIDVVNEPPPHTTPNYTANLGAGETGTYGWITKAFKLARQYCPGAVLIMNDYNNIEYGDQESHFIDIVKQIKAAGAPIDAVGCQSHALRTMSASQLQKNLDTMASQTGLPIYITEYDIGEANDATQLATYKAQIPIFRNTAAVKGVTIWGWINGRTWVANTGLVNGTTPRSAMTWLMGELGRPVPPN